MPQHKKRAHKKARETTFQKYEDGSSVYFNAVNASNCSFCEGWKTVQHKNFALEIKVPLPDKEAVVSGHAQFSYWGNEYVCPTTKNVVRGPSGIDIDREDGSETIFWLRPQCGCRMCMLAHPYAKTPPAGEAPLSFEESLIKQY